MKRKSLSKQSGPYLLLDIYLGGVSGAILEDGVLTHVVENKTTLPENNIVSHVIQNIHNPLQKTVENLLKKTKVTKTYIFIDTPLSYYESKEVLFEDKDASFQETKYQESTTSLDIPPQYKNILGVHSVDGVSVQHPPKNHTIQGYPTTNLRQKGEKRAQITGQWVQKHIFESIKHIEKVYAVGEVIFIAPTSLKNKDFFLLGDIVSSLWLQNKTFLIGLGKRLTLVKVAYENNVTFEHLESRLKSIVKNHAEKDTIYKTLHNETVNNLLTPLLKEKILEKYKGKIVYIGDESFVSLIQDSFSLFKNLKLETPSIKKHSRLMLMAKIVVE